MLTLAALTTLYYMHSYQWYNNKWIDSQVMQQPQSLTLCQTNGNNAIQNGLAAKPTPVYIYAECWAQQAAPVAPTCVPPNCPKTTVVINQ